MALFFDYALQEMAEKRGGAVNLVTCNGIVDKTYNYHTVSAPQVERQDYVCAPAQAAHHMQFFLNTVGPSQSRKSRDVRAETPQGASL